MLIRRPVAWLSSRGPLSAARCIKSARLTPQLGSEAHNFVIPLLNQVPQALVLVRELPQRCVPMATHLSPAADKGSDLFVTNQIQRLCREIRNKEKHNKKKSKGIAKEYAKRSNPAWRLLPPPSPCRINTKSKHHLHVNRVVLSGSQCS